MDRETYTKNLAPQQSSAIINLAGQWAYNETKDFGFPSNSPDDPEWKAHFKVQFRIYYYLLAECLQSIQEQV